jgi:hypothetical protein
MYRFVCQDMRIAVTDCDAATSSHGTRTFLAATVPTTWMNPLYLRKFAQVTSLYTILKHLRHLCCFTLSRNICSSCCFEEIAVVTFLYTVLKHLRKLRHTPSWNICNSYVVVHYLETFAAITSLYTILKHLRQLTVLYTILKYLWQLTVLYTILKSL